MGKVFIGIFLLILSFIFDFFRVHQGVLILLYASIFCLGLLYLYDGIIVVVRGKTFIRGQSRRIIHPILIAGIAAGIVTEAIGNWLFKFWIYPHFSPYFYLFIVPISLSFYFFILFENYVAIHIVLTKFFPSQKIATIKRGKVKDVFFFLLGFIGVAGFTFVTCEKLLQYTMPKNFLAVFNTYWLATNTIFDLFLLCISIWFVFEYLQYQRQEDTLLLHMFRGDFTAFLSIVGASGITSLAMELFNLPIKIWIYTNVPYHNFLFLGIPLVILLLWPFQYLLFDCFYHFLYKKETKTMWS